MPGEARSRWLCEAVAGAGMGVDDTICYAVDEAAMMRWALVDVVEQCSG